MTRPQWKHVRMGGVVLAVAAIAAVALWPESTAVDLAQAVRGPMEVTLDEDGETRVRERFVVSAPVAGRLQRIELEPGDAVVKGRTVVARLAPAAPPLLDPRARAEYDAAVAAATAGTDQARAERDRAARCWSGRGRRCAANRRSARRGLSRGTTWKSAQTAVATSGRGAAGGHDGRGAGGTGSAARARAAADARRPSAASWTWSPR